jgi:hypothetical protein
VFHLLLTSSSGYRIARRVGYLLFGAHPARVTGWVTVPRIARNIVHIQLWGLALRHEPPFIARIASSGRVLMIYDPARGSR